MADVVAVVLEPLGASMCADRRRPASSFAARWIGLNPLQSSSPAACGVTWLPSAGRTGRRPSEAADRHHRGDHPVRAPRPNRARSVCGRDHRATLPLESLPRLTLCPKRNPVARVFAAPQRPYAGSGGLDQRAQPARLAARRSARAARRRRLAARLPGRLGHLHLARPAVLADVEVHLHDAERASRSSSTRAADSNVRWDEVAGVEEVRAELEEVVEFLKDPARFAKLGARVPKGVLLYGPPGHRQDAARQGGRERVRGQLLLPERLVVRRDVERPRRRPDPAPVPDGAQEPARDHLHRRARRRRPPPRQRRPGRRQPGARPDAQPAAGRDGRLRRERPAGDHRRLEPARRARHRAPAPRPVRPPHRGRRRPTCRAASRSSEVHTRGKPLGRRRPPRRGRPADVRADRRRPREHLQRGGDRGRPRRSATASCRPTSTTRSSGSWPACSSAS